MAAPFRRCGRVMLPILWMRMCQLASFPHCQMFRSHHFLIPATEVTPYILNTATTTAPKLPTRMVYISTSEYFQRTCLLGPVLRMDTSVHVISPFLVPQGQTSCFLHHRAPTLLSSNIVCLGGYWISISSQGLHQKALLSSTVNLSVFRPGSLRGALGSNCAGTHYAYPTSRRTF